MSAKAIKSRSNGKKRRPKKTSAVLWPRARREGTTGRITHKVSATSLNAMRDTSIALDRALKRLADK